MDGLMVIGKYVAGGAAYVFINVFSCVLPAMTGAPASCVVYAPGPVASSSVIATPAPTQTPAPEMTPRYIGRFNKVADEARKKSLGE